MKKINAVFMFFILFTCITFMPLRADKLTNIDISPSQLINYRNETITNDNLAKYEPGPLMNTARMGHNYITLPDGKVVLLGGHGTGFHGLNTAEIWKPGTEEFTTMNMVYTHSWPIFDRLHDGTYLLAGGCRSLGIPYYATSEIYNPADSSFTAVSNMVRFRSGTGSATMSDGRVLIAGAWWTHNDAHTYGELYDPIKREFSAVGPFEVARSLTIVIPTADSGAVVLGGRTATGSLDKMPIEYFEPRKGKISTLHNSLTINDIQWDITNSWSRPSFMQQMPNGEYLWLGSHNEDNITEYILFTFNPVSKDIKQFVTEPPLPTSTRALFDNHPLIDYSRNKAYLVANVPERDTLSTITVYSIDLDEGTLTVPENSYGINYYISSAGMVLLNDGRIFISGGSSDRTNFNPVNNTILITPPEGVTSIDDLHIAQITKLQNNYPNPFNPQTNISFTLEKPQHITLEIYNMRGQRITTLANKKYPAGNHEVVWNGKDYNRQRVSSGVYYYQMITPSHREVKRMVLLK